MQSIEFPVEIVYGGILHKKKALQWLNNSFKLAKVLSSPSNTGCDISCSENVEITVISEERTAPSAVKKGSFWQVKQNLTT
jgi:hypothetical protein